MRHSSSTLEALHRLSSRNRDSVQGARECGCFFCLKTFKASDVSEWVPEPNTSDVTAVCPRCGIDSVLPAREGARIDMQILRAMRDYWFPHASKDPSDKDASGASRMEEQSLLRRLTWDLWESRKRT